jgi:hypothetical protein
MRDPDDQRSAGVELLAELGRMTGAWLRHAKKGGDEGT